MGSDFYILTIFYFPVRSPAYGPSSTSVRPRPALPRHRPRQPKTENLPEPSGLRNLLGAPDTLPQEIRHYALRLLLDAQPCASVVGVFRSAFGQIHAGASAILQPVF